MYNNKIFIMIMAGSMTMGLLNSSDCLSKTIKENNVVIMSENEYGIKNRANIKKISNLKRLHDERLKAYRAKQIKKACGVSVTATDRKILERIVEAEAGGEDHKGKVLVANVVLNRVKNKSFPSTIKDVVFAHRGGTYQFSPIMDGRYYTVNVSDDTKSAVKDALAGVDHSVGALYFMERALADMYHGLTDVLQDCLGITVMNFISKYHFMYCKCFALAAQLNQNTKCYPFYGWTVTSENNSVRNILAITSFIMYNISLKDKKIII